jgi:protocatechuate 3,4-dioxygenase beta subunit
MKQSRLVLAAVAVVALGAWQASARLTGERDPDPAPGGGNRSVEPADRAPDGESDGGEDAPARRRGRTVTISGTVRDAETHEGVGGVEVVLRGEAGEETTIADDEGGFRIDVPAGSYRAFVRDDAVLSVGYGELERVPEPPAADAAGAPDEAMMPVVVASADAHGVDLTVVRAGVVRGKVIDRAGRPIANAVLRASGRGLRSALGTDIAETGTDGTFELRLPGGGYDVEVTHARFAGLAGGYDDRRIAVAPGEVQPATFTLVEGCVITGRVVSAGGRPAGEGAIELQWGGRDWEFSPAAPLAADGTFRLATTAEDEVVLRAWPWGSPPTPSRSFACHDGARHDGVVLAVADRGPDMDGVLVDHGGAPVPHAYVDLRPLDGGMFQQERTDEHGRWRAFEVSGRYLVTAYAAGRGVAMATVNAPQREVRLTLGGTGRLEGKTPLLANGSFELVLTRCETEESSARLPAERRLVTVKDHAFTVDGLPACDLRFHTIWRGRDSREEAEVPAGGAARVELDVGPPRAKLVRGTVTDDAGRPVEGVFVQVRGVDGRETTTTDAAGRYELRALAGAAISAYHRDELRRGSAYEQVSLADQDEETIDLRMAFEEWE